MMFGPGNRALHRGTRFALCQRMTSGCDAVAGFDLDGRLIFSSRPFDREVSADVQESILRAIRAFDGSPDQQRQWVILGDRRILVQAVHGMQPGYVVSVFRRGFEPRTQIRGILSPRQLEIAIHAAQGSTAVEIAASLDISSHTVRQHLKEVYRRLDVANRVQLHELLFGTHHETAMSRSWSSVGVIREESASGH